MRTSVVVSSLIAGLLSATVPLHAQRVEAGVVVRSGPVAGHVVVRDGYSTYRRPVTRRVVAVERPRLVVVERVHRRGPAKQWSRRGYRPVTLYYWDGRYYDRPMGRRHDFRTIVVWERDGRYYHDCEHDRRSHHEHWDD
jgi:hypothetical protein